MNNKREYRLEITRRAHPSTPKVKHWVMEYFNGPSGHKLRIDLIRFANGDLVLDYDLKEGRYNHLHGQRWRLTIEKPRFRGEFQNIHIQNIYRLNDMLWQTYRFLIFQVDIL